MPVKIFGFILFILLLLGCQSSSVKEEPDYQPKIVNTSDLPSSNSNTPKEVTINASEVKILSSKTTMEKNSVIKEPDTPAVQPVYVPPVIAMQPIPVPQTPVIPKPEENTKVETKTPLKEEPPKPEPPAKKDYHTIRIIALENRDYLHKQCLKIQENLKKQNIEDVFLYEYTNKDGKKLWVIDVGKFDSPKAPEAQELFEKIKEMKFEGKKQFTGSYFVFKKA